MIFSYSFLLSMALLLLPIDIIGCVLSKLDKSYYFPLALTCKAFYENVLKSLNGQKTFLTHVKNYVTSVSLIEWAHTNGCPCNLITSVHAAKVGNIAVFQYLKQQECPWSDFTASVAITEGHLHILKYLHKNGCQLTSILYKYASYYGRLEMVEYLHKNGCPWHEKTCLIASRGKQLDILKYACENGCPWNYEECEYGAHEGLLDDRADGKDYEESEEKCLRILRYLGTRYR
jgi:hypothetical protein